VLRSPTEEVDQITFLSLVNLLFWDEQSNWQPLWICYLPNPLKPSPLLNWEQAAVSLQTTMRDERRKASMLYFLKVRVDNQRLTPEELWNQWEKEADMALRAKAVGQIVVLYKVVGQRRC
jgi:hypothetical protein